MNVITTLNLRARAMEAAERAEQAKRVTAPRYDVERASHQTTRLLAEVLDIYENTDTGVVVIDGLRLGARWLTVAGYTAWRLCLLEPCQLCRRDVATPLVAGEYTLGTLLLERQRGVEACHPPEVDCLRGGGS